MPLVFHEEIGKECLWGVWEISENVSFLTGQMKQLSDHENTVLRQIRHPVKQAESIAARLLVRALLRFWNLNCESILKNESKVPYFTNLSFFLSLSHTKKYAAAIIHRSSPAGIDIEQSRDKLATIAHKFQSEKEIFYPKLEALDYLAVTWVVKEAVYKMYGDPQISFKRDILLLPFRLLPEGGVEVLLQKENEPVKVLKAHYLKYDSHYLAYVIDKV